MKKNILERYSRTRDNKLIIDITADRVEDLYNNFDKHTPYVKKDLDQDLVAYLIDSASDMGKNNFIIQFHLDTPADKIIRSRVETSTYNYFMYLIELERRVLSKLMRSSIILSSIGIIILSLSVWLNQNLSEQATVIEHVIAEGLNVAAWVSLWNAIANYLINWSPHRQRIKMYARIANAPIVFKENNDNN
ncbi:MAG: hypothetical protein OEY43_10030 [Gammaproteobacteria bacterium]|nr:hypothetical protein [Gammaproteobacteria bacterium]